MNSRWYQGGRALVGRLHVTGIVLLLLMTSCSETGEPLPSWNDTSTRAEILEFVRAVTDSRSPEFVAAEERIAVFDNDGTLWVEQPMYTQLSFAVDRVVALAPEHPEWRSQQPFQAVLEGDQAALAAAGKHGLLEIIMATHAGMTTEEFSAVAVEWLHSARHPRFQRPYTELVYQPMLELLTFLRKNDFKTFIVSGGGVEFMRPFTMEVYGIPPEQVVGSSIVTEFEMRDGKPVLVRKPQLFFLDDKDAKPVAIQTFLGRRPLAAFGNSDGDLQMLQWTTAGAGRRFALLVHHDDAVREYAYDRDSHIGRLDRALVEAEEFGWTVVSMQRDWRQVFPSP